MTGERSVLRRDDGTDTATLSTGGRATGVLLGGSLMAVATSVGAGLPSLDGAILLLETERPPGLGLGFVDRQLTQLRRSGALHGLRAVALGRFPGYEGYADRGWTLHDVLADRLGDLGVPVLGGLEARPRRRPARDPPRHQGRPRCRGGNAHGRTRSGLLIPEVRSPSGAGRRCPSRRSATRSRRPGWPGR